MSKKMTPEQKAEDEAIRAYFASIDGSTISAGNQTTLTTWRKQPYKGDPNG